MTAEHPVLDIVVENKYKLSRSHGCQSKQTHNVVKYKKKGRMDLFYKKNAKNLQQQKGSQHCCSTVKSTNTLQQTTRQMCLISSEVQNLFPPHHTEEEVQ